ncbi:class I SAM-dependent methyltransferase [Longivirga aurantiaca]|uniref:Class I SAM-dependent methyltransferase n=1 Tax=Longivirga aurantiaca TaxID=1837743 RepID=A0ABW1SZJ0_9ACTN
MAAQQWDATAYDSDFSFVTAYGDVLLDVLAAQPGERILDIGCGTGHQAAALAALGADVVGVDSDAAMLEIARAEHPEVRFAQVDAQDSDALRAASGGAFDAVLSNAALHWMPRQDDVIDGIAQVLRPGGRLAVEMGGLRNVARTTEAIRAGRAAVGLDPDLPSSWTFPSPGDQAARLERHGFTVRSIALIDRPTPLADGVTTAGWAAMFGARLVQDVPAERRAEFEAAVDGHARTLGLLTPDGWSADYVRLRFHATLT